MAQENEEIIQAKGKEVEKLQEAKEAIGTIQKIFLLLVRSAYLQNFLDFLRKHFPNWKISSLDLKKIETNVTSFFTILVRFLTILTATALIISSMKGVLNPSFNIEAFKVPTKMIEEGMDGSAFSGRLMKKIDEISTSVKSIELSENSEQSTVIGKEGKFSTKISYHFNKNISNDDIVIMGISMNSVKKIIRSAFNLENKQISGSISKNKEYLELTLEVTGWDKTELVKVSEKLENPLDALVEEAALRILQKNDPKLIVMYYLSLQEYSRASRLIHELLKTPIDDSEKGEFFYYLGLINLLNNKNPKESIYDFEKSESFKFQSEKLYIVWGDAYFKLGDDNSANLKYEKAISLNSNSSEAYAKSCRANKWLERYEIAIKNCERALYLENSEKYKAISTMIIILNDLERYDEVIKYSQLLDFKVLDEYYYSVLRIYFNALIQNEKIEDLLEIKKRLNIDTNSLTHADQEIFQKLLLALYSKFPESEYSKHGLTLITELKEDNIKQEYKILNAMFIAKTERWEELYLFLQKQPDLFYLESHLLNLYQNSADKSSFLELANILYEKDFPLIAKYFYNLAIRSGKEDFLANLRLCDNLNHPISTEKYCSTAAKLNPASQEANFQNGLNLYKRKMYKEALPFLLEAINTENPILRNDPFLGLGTIYYILGNQEKARAMFLNYKYGNNFRLFKEAETFFQELKKEELLSFKSCFEDLFPESKSAFSDTFYYAFILEKIHKKTEAYEEYKKSIQEDGKDSQKLAIVNYQIANLLASQSKLEESSIYYLDVIKSAPERMNYLDYVNLGKSLKGDKAISAFKKSLVLSPKESEWFINLYLGKLYYETQDYQNSYLYFNRFYLYIKANNFLETINSIVKENIIDLDFFGYFLKSSIIAGDFTKAKEIIKRMLVNDSQNPRLYKGLGLYYEKTGDKEKAILSYEKSIDLTIDPGIKTYRALPYFDLGNLYTQVGEYDKAIITYKKAIEHFPSDTEAMKALVQTLKKNNQREEANKIGKELLKYEF